MRRKTNDLRAEDVVFARGFLVASRFEREHIPMEGNFLGEILSRIVLPPGVLPVTNEIRSPAVVKSEQSSALLLFSLKASDSSLTFAQSSCAFSSNWSRQQELAINLLVDVPTNRRGGTRSVDRWGAKKVVRLSRVQGRDARGGHDKGGARTRNATEGET